MLVEGDAVEMDVRASVIVDGDVADVVGEAVCEEDS